MLGNNYTLIIDGHYFIYSKLWVLSKFNKKDYFNQFNFNNLNDLDNESLLLLNKLCIDFAFEVRKFKNIINRIIFTWDSKSWRKNFHKDLEYKKNRTYNLPISWDKIDNVINKFSEILLKQGIIITKIENTEADDLIFYWVKYLNNKNQNCIILSRDSDLKQLINYDVSTDTFCLLYDNVSNTILSPIYFNEWLNKKEDKEINENKNENIDIFNDNFNLFIDSFTNNIKKEWQQIIDKNKLKVVSILSDEYIFQKILTGDISDNISSVSAIKADDILFKNKNVTSNKASIILDTFKKKYGKFLIDYLFDDKYKNEICDLIIEMLKYKNEYKNLIKEKLDLNIKLILLNEKTIPDEVQKNILNHINSIDLNTFDLKINNLINKDKILKSV